MVKGKVLDNVSVAQAFAVIFRSGDLIPSRGYFFGEFNVTADYYKPVEPVYTITFRDGSVGKYCDGDYWVEES